MRAAALAFALVGCGGAFSVSTQAPSAEGSETGSSNEADPGDSSLLGLGPSADTLTSADAGAPGSDALPDTDTQWDSGVVDGVRSETQRDSSPDVTCTYLGSVGVTVCL